MKINRSILSSAKKSISVAFIVTVLLSLTIIQPVCATTTQRNTAIATMSSMRNFQWTANGNVTIYGNTYLNNTAYTGMPYTQNADTTIAGFIASPTMTYSNEYGSFYYFSQPSSDVGNDCSAAVAISWSSGGSSINVSSVYSGQMLAAIRSSQNCMAKRGTYSTPNGVYTDVIVSLSDRETLYDPLVAGDACFYKTSSTGHAILITGNNTSTNTVTYIEQIGAGSGGSRLSGTHSTWTSGTKTYLQLFNAYYVPIRATDI